jgi:3-(3-hydroxy-phenyl)propionate hydroxylase
MRFLVPQTDADRVRRRQVLERARYDAVARAEVDSGRLAEPFWYVDSPLTTPDARRPFGGRPPKGQVPPPGPGVLAPDHPLPRPVAGASRLRSLLREGVTVLLGDHVDLSPPGGTAPVASYRFDALAPGLAAVFGARPDEAWVVRPDAHVAAVLDDPQPIDLRRCLDRLLCRADGGAAPATDDAIKVVT